MNADGMKVLRRVERSAGRVDVPKDDRGNERKTPERPIAAKYPRNLDLETPRFMLH